MLKAGEDCFVKLIEVSHHCGVITPELGKNKGKMAEFPIKFTFSLIILYPKFYCSPFD